jgi:hypothetical protein
LTALLPFHFITCFTGPSFKLTYLSFSILTMSFSQFLGEVEANKETQRDKVELKMYKRKTERLKIELLAKEEECEDLRVEL